jgi:copper chaperone CopZ
MLRSLFLTAALLLANTVATAATIELKVFGLVCGFCAQGIEKTLRKKPAVEDVVVSLENKLVAVATRSGLDLSDAELRKALQDAGYTVKAIARTERSMTEIRDQLAKKP